MHLDTGAPAIAGLAQTTDRLHPEHLLDALADALADNVAEMAHSACVERRASRPRVIARDMRRDLERAVSSDEVAGVVTAVAGQGDAPVAGQSLIGHRQRRAPLGVSVGRLDLKVHQYGI